MNTVIEQICARLASPVVLVPIPPHKKGPNRKGWQLATVADMSDPAYLARFHCDGNIGVVLGEPSGGLCTIDLDSQEELDSFLSLNPRLTAALRTTRVRGGNLWVRVTGEYPAASVLKDRASRKKLGEWRATGNQTVIHGAAMDASKGETKPTAYRIVKDAPPLDIAFAEIQWPDAWLLPWIPEENDPATKAEQELIVEHGAAFTSTERGKVAVNAMYFVARFAGEHDVLHEANEGCFFAYDPADGLWKEHTTHALKIEFAADLKVFADAQAPKVAEQIINMRHERFLGGLVGLLQGYTEEREAFQKPDKIIHAKNGMVHLDAYPARLLPFNAQYRSRNCAPVGYESAADCPRFKRELLDSALDPDDVSLIQRYAGSILLAHNAAQRILILVGTAGGGKSTVVEIIEKVIGLKNVGQLRTKYLSDRFEIGRLIGRTLLTGKDVDGNFLELPGASQLKSLVGHDLLDAELKTSNGQFQIRGDFGMLITANSRLHVRLDGDTDAWRRRLLIMSYIRPKPERRIPDFADMLLAEEGPGIFAWMVEGAYRHLAELQEHGDFRLTEQQKRRVSALLAESDSVREFIRDRVESHQGSDVAVYELTEAYSAYCDEMGWEPLSIRRVENVLTDAMQELRRAAKRNGIERNGKACRGFSNVRLMA